MKKSPALEMQKKTLDAIASRIFHPLSLINGREQTRLTETVFDLDPRSG